MHNIAVVYSVRSILCAEELKCDFRYFASFGALYKSLFISNCISFSGFRSSRAAADPGEIPIAFLSFIEQTRRHRRI